MHQKHVTFLSLIGKQYTVKCELSSLFAKSADCQVCTWNLKISDINWLASPSENPRKVSINLIFFVLYVFKYID